MSLDPAMAAAIAERDWGESASTVSSAPHANDLILAIASLAGDPGALQVLDELVQAAVSAAAARIGLEHAERQEVEQRLRVRLLTSQDDRPPRLAAFRGEGALRSWLHVCATREALMLRRRPSPEVSLDAHGLEPWMAALDPELSMLEADGRTVFKRALQAALEALDDEQRALLACVLLDGMPQATAARLFEVDASTVSRRLQAIRQHLLDRSRTFLASHHGLSPDEVDQLSSLVHSQLTLSLDRVLRPRGRGPG